MFKPFQEELERFFDSVGLPITTSVTPPPSSELGDVAIPCFILAKKLQKSPVEMARQLALSSDLKAYPLLERIKAEGPFLNITFSTAEVAQRVLSYVAGNEATLGQDHAVPSERVMIEYSQPNTHKEFHIGHLRNVVIGSTMVRVYRALGYTVRAANYIGDVGAHVAKCLWYIKKFAWTDFVAMQADASADRGKWLGQMYVLATQALEKDPLVKAEIDAVQRELEAETTNDWISLWQETRTWSLDSFTKIYHTLGVQFDDYFYESEVEKPGKQMVKELLSRGIATVGEGGAIVVDLTPFKLETFLLLKSDGSSLYATKDIALAVKKFADFAIDRSVYITDNRQKFYFTQLFKVLELAGWKKNMVFLGYDFVTLPDGAMSSRKGNVVLFSELFEDIKESLATETRPRHTDWTSEHVDNTVEKLALAAIKFGILKHPSDKVIVFNKAEAISFEGFSGPYVLYAIARINSILRKASGKGFSPSIETVSTLTHATEKKLLLIMAGYSDMLHKTLAQHNPSVVAKYCFDLAQAFNDWYAQCEVVAETDVDRTRARLILAQTVKTVLSKALACMGIETVEEM